MTELRDMSKGITDLAKEVTANQTTWATFQKDPRAYAASWAKKNNTVISLDDTAVTKIKNTSYADAKAKLTSTDLNRTAGYW
jgi:hypothetical protein